MSDYYDWVITCEFEHTLSRQVIETLRYMTRTEDYAFDDPPDHPLFIGADLGSEDDAEAGADAAWRQLLIVPPDEETGYFARFFRFLSPRVTWAPGYDAPYILSFRLDVHEDEVGEYGPLMDWLAGVSSSRGLVGYCVVQDGRGDPTLWYFQEGKAVMRWVNDAGGEAER